MNKKEFSQQKAYEFALNEICHDKDFVTKIETFKDKYYRDFEDCFIENEDESEILLNQNLDVDEYFSLVTRYHNTQYSAITYDNVTNDLKFVDLSLCDWKLHNCDFDWQIRELKANANIEILWQTKNFTGFRPKEFSKKDIEQQLEDAKDLAELFFDNNSLLENYFDTINEDEDEYLDTVYYDENENVVNQKYYLDEDGEKLYYSSGSSLKENLSTEQYLEFVDIIDHKYYKFFTWEEYKGFEYHGYDTNEYNKYLSEKFDAEANGTIFHY